MQERPEFPVRASDNRRESRSEVQCGTKGLWTLLCSRLEYCQTYRAGIWKRQPRRAGLSALEGLGDQAGREIFEGLGSADGRSPSLDATGSRERGHPRDKSCHEAWQVLPVGQKNQGEGGSFHDRGAAPYRGDLPWRITSLCKSLACAPKAMRIPSSLLRCSTE